MYIFNGFLMTVTFGIFRIYFYHVMIFDILLTFVVYRTHSFWPIFYKGKFVQRLAQVSMCLYILMYFLQLFWFCKILEGFLKSIGVESLFVSGDDGESTDNEETDEEPKKLKKN